MSKPLRCLLLVIGFWSLVALCAVAARAQVPNGLSNSSVGRVGVASAPAGAFNKTGLVAWYDFDSTADAHGSFTLTEVGTPSYTAGYGVATAAGNKWTQATLLTTLFASPGDKTYIIRFRPYGTITTGTGVVGAAAGSNFTVVHRTAGARGRIYESSDVTSATGTALNTWAFFVMEYDNTAGVARLYVNNGSAASLTVGSTTTTSTVHFGGSSSLSADVEISVFACFTRLLTADERTRLYNSGNDITYADL